MKIIPKIISVVFLWSLVVYLVIFVDPELVRDVGIKGSYLPFFLALFFALFYTLSLIFKTIKVGLAIAGLVVLGLLLSVFNVISIFSIVLIVVLAAIVLYRHYANKD